MAKRKTLKPRKERRPAARQTAAGLMAAAMAASVASPVSAAEYRTLLQGQIFTLDASLFSDSSVVELESYDFDETYLVTGEEPFQLKAISPTAQGSTLVTLYGRDEFHQTVTESVYIDIVENVPPEEYYYYDSQSLAEMRPGGYGTLALLFYDPDSSDFHDIERLVYTIEGLPEYFSYEVVNPNGPSAYVKILADDTAVPGTYPATLKAGDIWGNETNVPITVRLNPALAPFMPYFSYETFVDSPVPSDLLHITLSGMIPPADYPYDDLVIEHDYGSDVEYDDVAGLVFHRAGTFEMKLYARNSVYGDRSLPVTARFHVSEQDAVNSIHAVWYGTPPSSPARTASDLLYVQSDLPGNVYLMPHEQGPAPTAEDLELMADSNEAFRISLHSEFSAPFEAYIPLNSYIEEEGWYALSIARDGQVSYSRQFYYAGETLDIDDILKYYKQPVHPPQDPFMLQLLLHSISRLTMIPSL